VVVVKGKPGTWSTVLTVAGTRISRRTFHIVK
jgi:hypothetical protein